MTLLINNYHDDIINNEIKPDGTHDKILMMNENFKKHILNILHDPNFNNVYNEIKKLKQLILSDKEDKKYKFCVNSASEFQKKYLNSFSASQIIENIIKLILIICNNNNDIKNYYKIGGGSCIVGGGLFAYSSPSVTSKKRIIETYYFYCLGLTNGEGNIYNKYELIKILLSMYDINIMVDHGRMD